MEPLLDWVSFFWVCILLIILFIILKFVGEVTPYFIANTSFKRKIKKIINSVVETYKPLSILILLMSFVAINFVIHGLLLLVIGIIGFSHVKNYLQGILFKINPLVDLGSFINVGEFEGEIEDFLAFGFIINLSEGKRFISYKYVEEKGFFINQQDHGILRKTVYISKEISANMVLDLLFENPMLNFTQKPIIRDMVGEKVQELQFTLEKGVSMDSLISYLNQNNIPTLLQNKNS